MEYQSSCFSEELYRYIYTIQDRSQIALFDLRSSLLWESVRTRLDRSQFACEPRSHSDKNRGYCWFHAGISKKTWPAESPLARQSFYRYGFKVLKFRHRLANRFWHVCCVYVGTNFSKLTHGTIKTNRFINIWIY